MMVFAQAISIDVIVFKPPIIPTHNWLVDFVEEFPIMIHLIQLPSCPGDQWRFRDIRLDGKSEPGYRSLIMYSIGDHPVRPLMIKQDTQLVVRKMWVNVTIRKRMKVGIPLPNTHIVNHGGGHRLACGKKPRGDKSGTHNPPGIIILRPVLFS